MIHDISSSDEEKARDISDTRHLIWSDDLELIDKGFS